MISGVDDSRDDAPRLYSSTSTLMKVRVAQAIALLGAKRIFVAGAASPVMQALSTIETGTYLGRSEAPPVIAMMHAQYMRGTIANARYAE